MYSRTDVARADKISLSLFSPSRSVGSVLKSVATSSAYPWGLWLIAVMTISMVEALSEF